MNPDLDLALRLADAADAITLPRFRASDLRVERKPDRTPVTDADLAAEDALRAVIGTERPGDEVLGEERGGSAGSTERAWVLDPIDGTKSFISGRPIFGTLIALVRDGRPILGIIDQPILEERWVGADGRATVFNGREIATRPCGALGDAMANTTSPDLFSGADVARFAALAGSVWHMQYGGDCYAYAMLATGFLDVVVEADLKPYDFCALAPIINGAGGLITDWRGQPLTVESDGHVAAVGDPSLMPAAIKILNP